MRAIFIKTVTITTPDDDTIQMDVYQDPRTKRLFAVEEDWSESSSSVFSPFNKNMELALLR